jgi:RNA recognition motif-containing protein
VEFSLAEDAREAIDNMDQSELYGRVIKCNQAKPQKDASEGLGSRTAVWEQVCSAENFLSICIEANMFAHRKDMLQSTTSPTTAQVWQRKTLTSRKTLCKA